MANKNVIYLMCLSILSINSCSIKKTVKLETPFVTVVKLIDAEQSIDIDVAMQYMDIVQVYSKLGSENPIEDWKKTIKFNYDIGKDNKFTNNFGYAKYDIEETIKGKNAIVCFNAKDTSSTIKAIIYGLEKRQNKWIVISIDYLKK